jgi:DNA-binding IclR family transcriptional regulator
MAVRARSSRQRLRNLLDRLNPGDEIRVAAASQETGLDQTTCASVLEALARVDLFTRTGDGAFVRRRMFDALERLSG